jgi:hypothetical protein
VLGQRRHRDGRRVPVGLRLDGGSKSLEAFGQLGSIALLRSALEHELRGELRDTLASRRVAD